METYIINVAEHTVDERLKGFDLSKKPSSNVDYYGSNGKDTIFIQFKNGVSYLYHDVKKEDIDAMNQAESIGKFMSILSRKQYQFTKITLELVKSKSQDENPAKE